MTGPARKSSQQPVRQGDPFGDGYQDVPGREARTALSALNLRTALAVFGLVVCGFLAWWSIELEAPVGAGILSFLALTAVVDLIVIQRRRRQRAAGPPGRPH
ncbi:MAG TPA: DUF6343 family protein, partial [Acidothermaceae bacterium]